MCNCNITYNEVSNKDEVEKVNKYKKFYRLLKEVVIKNY